MFSYSWIIGVIIVIFDTLIGTVGKQMLRLSHTLNEKKSQLKYISNLYSIRSRVVKAVAICLVMIVNPVLSLISYNFASPVFIMCNIMK